jgi:hypothetical protein
MFPQLSRVARVIEFNNGSGDETVEVGCSYQMEWESLERDDRVYALLARYCTSFLVENCVSEAISASSTDNYPEESVENTLQSANIVERRASYWSSKGQRNPAVPETLIFKLASELCVITEINIRPFQGIVSKFLQTMCSSSLTVYTSFDDDVISLLVQLTFNLVYLYIRPNLYDFEWVIPEALRM